jgi:hypothetical protein
MLCLFLELYRDLSQERLAKLRSPANIRILVSR